MESTENKEESSKEQNKPIEDFNLKGVEKEAENHGSDDLDDDIHNDDPEALKLLDDLVEQEQYIERIKDIRLNIDVQIQYTESVFGKKSKVFNLLFHSKAWLGKLLEQSGNKNPYTTKEPVKNAVDIPPTAERSNTVNLYDFKLINEIEKINFLRDKFALCIDDVESLSIDNDFLKNKRLAAIARTQSYVNLCEARFELGYELSLIRDKNR